MTAQTNFIKSLEARSSRSRRNKIAHTLQARANARRKLPEKVADRASAIFGSMTFLALNLLWFAIWIPVNLGLIPGVEPFDPYPFGLLTTAVSLEAIVLAILVLISQNRAEKVATLRQEVDLLINTQTEAELTKLLILVKMLAEKQGIDLSTDSELAAMLKPTDIEQLEDALEQEVNGK